MIGTEPARGRRHTGIDLEDNACPLCSSADATLVASVEDYEYRTVDLALQYYRCAQCGLTYLRPRPVPECMQATYPTGYEQYSEGMLSASVKRLIQHLRTRLVVAPRIRRVLGLVQPADRLRILDIGCGNGHALLAAREIAKDCETHGVDLGSGQGELLARRGILFHAGAFEDAELPESYFDVILLIHSIEHFADPVGVMRKVSRLLRPGGVAYLETHVAGCLEQKLFGRYWIGFDSPRHVTVFSRSSLGEMVRRADLRCIAYDDRAVSIGDAIYSLRRRCCGLPGQRVLRLLVSDRNPFLLLASVAFNIARLRFAGSSVAGMAVQKGWASADGGVDHTSGERGREDWTSTVKSSS